MSVEENKATLRRIYAEIWNKGNWSVIPELIAPSYHYSNRKGHQGYKENVSSARSAFPDLHYTIDAMVGEGNWVAVRLSETGTMKGKYFNSEPTGKRYTGTRAVFYRFARGKLVEAIPFANALPVYQQLGITPPAAPAPAPAARAR